MSNSMLNNMKSKIMKDEAKYHAKYDIDDSIDILNKSKSSENSKSDHNEKVVFSIEIQKDDAKQKIHHNDNFDVVSQLSDLQKIKIEALKKSKLYKATCRGQFNNDNPISFTKTGEVVWYLKNNEGTITHDINTGKINGCVIDSPDAKDSIAHVVLNIIKDSGKKNIILECNDPDLISSFTSLAKTLNIVLSVKSKSVKSKDVEDSKYQIIRNI